MPSLPKGLTEPYWETWLRWHLYRSRHRTPWRRAHYETMMAFRNALRESDGQIFIDAGANLGAVSKIALDNGMLVHAFEPDPHAADELQRRLGAHPRLTLHRSAVGANARRETLYSPSSVDLNVTDRSSLFVAGDNDGGRATDVEVVDLFSFMSGLGQPVAILKLDVEGAEFEILERFLIERPPVGLLFVETHETFKADFPQRLDRIREGLRDPALKTRVFLNWP